MTEARATYAATNARLLKRSVESLLGIASGLIADGELNDTEIQFLSTWLAENSHLAATWPGEVVLKRVNEVLSDGKVNADERSYLEKTLVQLIGGSFCEDGAAPSESTRLPIDEMAQVHVSDASFCFTGQFLFGTRAACERAVEQRGGRVASVTRNLDYLVIGELASRDWKYTSFGRKIQSAIDVKQNGASLEIVGEAQWVRAL